MDVKITFRTSSNEAHRDGGGLHERTLSSVPADEAERMVEDFTRSRTTPSEAVRRMCYRFQRDGDDVIVALDFDHVVALKATES